MKYVSRPKSAATKDIDNTSISPIFGVTNIDIGKGDIDPSLPHTSTTHFMFIHYQYKAIIRTDTHILNSFIMPPPRGHNAMIGVRRPSV